MRHLPLTSVVFTAALSLAPVLSAAEPAPLDFVRLGTPSGLGGVHWTRYERSQIKHQIKQLIPPNLQSAFAGDAYTLPPGAFRVGVAGRFARVNGDDFFDDNNAEPVDLSDRVVRRNFSDLDLFYGFDLDRRFLHSFTLRVNVPILNSQVGGVAYPEGFKPGMTLLGDGGTQDLGDIGVFLKKKIEDQGNFPFGVAMMGGVTLPTGSSRRRFANEGRGTQMIMPQADNCMGGPVMTPTYDIIKMMLNMPMCVHMDKMVQVPYPASRDGVFDRFATDGRLPAVLQPGLGAVSYTAGLFFSRQFMPGDWGPLDSALGRGAAHMGATHQFVFEHDGVDPGDTTNFFLSFVKPLFRDYLSLDATFLGKRQETDRYSGKIFHPFPNGQPNQVVFREIDRPPFAGGITGYLAPSLIFSPDPQLRFTLSQLLRVKEPELGPASKRITRLAMEVTF